MSAVAYLGLDKKGPAHVGYDDLNWETVEPGYEEAVVELDRGDSSWNPASTKNVVWGPAKVTYVRRPSGITAYVE